MKVYRGLDALPRRRPRAAVTVGNFDGVHRGHTAIVRRLRRIGESAGAAPTVVTFDPHPQLVLHGEAPPALATLERRIEFLVEAGAEQVVVLTFDRTFSTVEPEEFVERVLVGELRAASVVVGSNFRFGHFARGDITMLRSFGLRLGFTVEGARLVEVGGRRVTSTAVRHALAEGDLAWANRALERPHRVPGRVVRGMGRGRGLGFPTANVEPTPRICLPRIGIYAGRLRVEGKPLDAAISVGTQPTFGDNPVTVEAYALDFEGDLYGREAEVEFLVRIRDEMAFGSPEALVAAIADDVERARRALAGRG